MVSAKITADTRIRKDGTISLYLRVIIDRKVYRKKLLHVKHGQFLPGKGLVKPDTKDHVKINQVLTKAVADVNAYVLDCQAKGRPINAELIMTGQIGKVTIKHLPIPFLRHLMLK